MLSFYNNNTMIEYKQFIDSNGNIQNIPIISSFNKKEGTSIIKKIKRNYDPLCACFV